MATKKNTKTAKRDITNEPWMTCLSSTGIPTSYYSWEGNNFTLKGERGDERIEILKKYPDLFKRKSVVDVGCNLGRILHYAFNEGGANDPLGFEQDYNTFLAAEKILEIEGIDDSEGLIRYRNFLHNPNIPTTEVAIAFSVLHHINPRVELLKSMNTKVRETIIIESGIEEYPFNSQPTSQEDIWKFKDYEAMYSYLLSHLNNFKFGEVLGISERNRQIFTLIRK